MNPWQILKTISVIFRAKNNWFTKNPINNRVGDGIYFTILHNVEYGWLRIGYLRIWPFYFLSADARV